MGMGAAMCVREGRPCDDVMWPHAHPSEHCSPAEAQVFNCLFHRVSFGLTLLCYCWMHDVVRRRNLSPELVGFAGKGWTRPAFAT